jgi:integrase
MAQQAGDPAQAGAQQADRGRTGHPRAALLTGCRYSELARLKCGNFNRDSGTLAIRLSKGKIKSATSC